MCLGDGAVSRAVTKTRGAVTSANGQSKVKLLGSPWDSACGPLSREMTRQTENGSTAAGGRNETRAVSFGDQSSLAEARQHGCLNLGGEVEVCSVLKGDDLACRV